MSTTEEVAHAPRGTQGHRVTVHGRREYATNPVWAVRDSLNPNLTMGHKAVLFALASRIGIDGTDARPSLERLATDAGGSAGGVKALVDELVTWGIVLRTHVTSRLGWHCEYAIDLAALADTKPLPVSARRAADRKRVRAKLGSDCEPSGGSHEARTPERMKGVLTDRKEGIVRSTQTGSHGSCNEVSIGKDPKEAAREEYTLTHARARTTEPESTPSKPLAKTTPRAAATRSASHHQPVDAVGAAEIAKACHRNPRHGVAQTVRLFYGGDYERCSASQLDFVRTAPDHEAKYHDEIARIGIHNLPVVAPPQPGETIIVGSHHTCDVVIDAACVARQHLKIVGTGRGYLVTSLDERCPTFFGSDPIQPNTEVRVAHGAPLVMGDYAIRIGHPTAAMAAA